MAAEPRLQRPRHRSIRWRLPVLICVLMLAAVAAFGWAAYGAVEQVLLTAGRTRVANVAQQVGQLLDNAIVTRLEESRRLASRPGVATVFAEQTPETLARAAQSLDTYLGASPQTISVALWSADGRKLVERPELSRGTDSLAQDSPPAAAGVGAIYETDGIAYYDVAVRAPLEEDGGPGGFLVTRRRTATAGAGEALRGLMGGNTTLAIGTAETGVWTNHSEVIPAPALPAVDGAIDFADPRTGETEIGVARRVGDSPWTMWLYTPRSAILAPARQFLLGMIPLTLLIVGLGAVIAWVTAGQILSPLTELTATARGVSQGDLSRRVDASRQDEFGVVGEAFNTMLARVQASHDELDARVHERTRDLREALATLEQTQAELVRREKLAMLGQLASSVGHELRNPLGVMTNAVYVLEMVQPGAPDQVREYYGLLRAQIGLAEKIISDLLDFGRIKPPQREAVALRTIVDEQLARAGDAADIEVIRDFPEPLPRAFVDRFQVGQIVLNLIVNAMQAMEGRPGARLTLRGVAEGDGLRLEVSDTGPGVAPEHREKIFEALFTTKARGIGLGLAVSAGLAEANGGALRLGAGGPGATFVLSLPSEQAVPLA
ncbi:MAG: sensor histidine kinase [Vicinamibacterales bacterium]